MGIAGSNRKGGGGSGSYRPRRDTAGSKSSGKTTVGESRYCLSIRSDFAATSDIQKQILTDVARCGFNHHCAFAIKLALEEALINAIKHGNRFDPGKKVHIDAVISAGGVEIVVEDEGPGFDRRCVPDPTLEENLNKCSGRGILLIETYMNQVEWSRGGRRLRMVLKNEWAAGSAHGCKKAVSGET